MIRIATAILAIAYVTGEAALGQSLFLDKDYAVTVTKDVTYDTGTVNFSTSPSTVPLLLDLYEPTGFGVPPMKPGIVLVHGGSWITGAKDSPATESLSGSGDFNTSMTEYATEFAKRGYVCVSIDYRLILDNPDGTGLLSTGPADISNLVNGVQNIISGMVTVPDDQVRRAIEAGVADTAKAVNWMSTNAASLGIDPTRIAVGGYSAGAWNSLWAAYAAGAPVAAVWSNSGGMRDTEFFIANPSDPPAILFHGTFDLINFVTRSRAVDTQLDAIGVPHEYFEMVGENHFYLRTKAISVGPVKSSGTLEDHLAAFLYGQMNLAALPPAALPAISTSGIALVVVLLAAFGGASVICIRKRRVV